MLWDNELDFRREYPKSRASRLTEKLAYAVRFVDRNKGAITPCTLLFCGAAAAFCVTAAILVTFITVLGTADDLVRSLPNATETNEIAMETKQLVVRLAELLSNSSMFLEPAGLTMIEAVQNRTRELQNLQRAQWGVEIAF
jgi:hypothetical protein